MALVVFDGKRRSPSIIIEILCFAIGEDCSINMLMMDKSTNGVHFKIKIE